MSWLLGNIVLCLCSALDISITISIMELYNLCDSLNDFIVWVTVML